jgi:hypothetical protein
MPRVLSREHIAQLGRRVKLGRQLSRNVVGLTNDWPINKPWTKPLRGSDMPSSHDGGVDKQGAAGGLTLPRTDPV